MPWKIVDGRMVRVGPTAPELTVRSDAPTDLACPFCDRRYKTERGLESHLATHK